jgi:electron transfer flavoprotein alpha subunit
VVAPLGSANETAADDVAGWAADQAGDAAADRAFDAAADAAKVTGQLTFAAEVARLGGQLGMPVRFVTWTTRPNLDFGALVAAVGEVAEQARPVAVIVQDGDAGRQLASLLAERLGTAAVLGCSDVKIGTTGDGTACDGAAAGQRRSPAITFVKPVYGGWLEQEISAAEGFVPVATLDLAGLEPSEAALEPAAAALSQTEVLRPAAEAFPRIRHLETVPPDARSVDLVHAKRIVAAGMGTANQALLASVHELAGLLEGSVGATRPVVDEGHLPKERLIGQTGRSVAPDLYVALGVSGSPHHVAGVRKADRVLSINRDSRAPIFQFSDMGYVADLESVLPMLVARIKEWRDAESGGVEPGGAERGPDGR